MRKHRANKKPSQGRLQDLSGKLVGSEHRAETLAEYFEKVQWRVNPPRVTPDRPHLGEELPVPVGDVTCKEVVVVLNKLRRHRAAGKDNAPPDFWKAVLETPGSLRWAIDLCQACWSAKSVPDGWHDARVVAIFKKGDDALPSNYRPISLLSVAYKIFAGILLQRLRKGGAEARVRRTQFGFRSEVGTTDALFVARRLIDEAWAQADGCQMMLLLDWAKAFDRIDPAAMHHALLRFGVPQQMVDMISEIYTGRRFTVQDGGHESGDHAKGAGISQGCPLSPFLFIIVMTVLLEDVDAEVSDRFGWSAGRARETIRDIIYADDTMLIEKDPVILQFVLKVLAKTGQEYGLELHLGKTFLLPIRHGGSVHGGDGKAITHKASAVYL